MADFNYDGEDLAAMSHAPKYHHWILSEFSPYLGKRVAEVGSGSGLLTLLIGRESIEELVAVEPSRDMYDLLQTNIAKHPHIKARNAFFPEVSSEYKDHFDAVVYISVLEHVEDETKELRAVYESLKPGGHVCIFVPALSWLYSHYDAWAGHYRRYHKKELVARLKEAGFEVVSVRYFDFLGILPWLIFIKWMRGKLIEGNVSAYDRFVVPVAAWMESLINPPLGKNLVIVGRKPLS